jgi:DNA uptake protein ComE-like DNA-binding protein
MKGWFRVFEFSQREQKGIWILVALIIFSYVAIHFYENYSEKSFESLSKEEFAKVAARLNNIEKEKQIESYPNIELFEFDANRIGFDSLQILGLSESLSRRFIKFREAIGGFKSIKDIKKIYGLNDSIFRELEPYVRIKVSETSMAEDANTVVNENSKANELPKQEIKEKSWSSSNLTIELNSASANDLRKIKGIGETLSNRIIKYRDAMGGFFNSNQIFDVYGVESTNLDLVNITLEVDTSLVTMVNINNGEISDFTKHPLINSYQAKILIAYRKQHGNFRNESDIAASKAFTDKEMQAVLPYLAIK